MAISEELLKILVCPKCKGALVPSEEGDSLDCNECRLRYSVDDDIPVMLASEAMPLD